ncbi:Mpo1-like protein [Pontixanthobacter sp.]|uniref:Mpo1-like protein n=1 Tax=Pontixanthobacter sp. TaxID=2792078 RepID=UPI003C7BBB9D
MIKTYTTFAEFWPFYLREHSLPETRALHYVGSTLVLAIAGVAIWQGVNNGTWWWLIGMPVAGYFFAWVAHFTIEKNRPATFTYPLWSLGADFKMYFMWITGRLDRELESAGIKR